MPTINKLKRHNKPCNDNKKNGNDRKIRQSYYRTTEWKKLRSAKLQEHPLCELCNEALAEDVHHIISFMSVSDEMGKMTLFYDPANLMALCRKCHNKMHQKSKL